MNGAYTAYQNDSPPLTMRSNSASDAWRAGAVVTVGAAEGAAGGCSIAEPRNTSSGRSRGSIGLSDARTTRRSTMFFSSRTLPGQAYCVSRESVACEIVGGFTAYWRLN